MESSPDMLHCGYPAGYTVRLLLQAGPWAAMKSADWVELGPICHPLRVTGKARGSFSQTWVHFRQPPVPLAPRVRSGWRLALNSGPHCAQLVSSKPRRLESHAQGHGAMTSSCKNEKQINSSRPAVTLPSSNSFSTLRRYIL